MPMPLDTGCTSYVERGVGSRGLTALLGLVDDPDYQRDEQDYKRHPEQQHEQHAEEATAHHGTAHHRAHAAPAKNRTEQQDDDRPDQSPEEYLQAVAHGLLTPPFLWSDLSIPSRVCECMSKFARPSDQHSPI